MKFLLENVQLLIERCSQIVCKSFEKIFSQHHYSTEGEKKKREQENDKSGITDVYSLQFSWRILIIFSYRLKL